MLVAASLGQSEGPAKVPLRLGITAKVDSAPTHGGNSLPGSKVVTGRLGYVRDTLRIVPPGAEVTLQAT